MKTIHSAAQAAGARPRRDSDASKPTFRPVLRRDLMRTLRAVRRDLGLSTGDLLVLDALLSFLPCRDKATGADRPVTPDMMLVIYASNASVCGRANDMDDRVLRRHVARLERAGLVVRRMSATGKRFPLKSGGAVRDAFGVDLTPLLHRYAELLDLARKLEERRDALRSLRAEALALRARLLTAADQFCDATVRFLDHVKTVLRRSTLTPDLVENLLARLRGIADGDDRSDEAPCPAASTEPAPFHDKRNLPSEDASSPDERATSRLSADNRRDAETDDASGGNGQNVRQVESPKIDPYPRDQIDDVTIRRAWRQHPTISEFMPDAPRSPRELLEKIYLFGGMMKLKHDDLVPALKSLGWVGTVSALDYLAERAGRIVSPPAYLERMIADHDAGRPVGWLKAAG